MKHLCFNGIFRLDNEPILTAQNRSFRYGDGVFETMKVYRNQIRLEQFHFDRLIAAMRLLNINAERIVPLELPNLILQLCEKNNCLHSARVRLAIWREDDNSASYVVETMPLPQNHNQLNTEGWAIDFFPFARKANDAFANLKSANYLPYVLADRYAKEKRLDEAIVLNTENKICDASKANVFLVKKNEVFTPALHQGCVNGVMRRMVIDELKRLAVRIHQIEIGEQQLADADEVFLTNAINDIRWVKTFRKKTYENKFIKDFYSKVFSGNYS